MCTYGWRYLPKIILNFIVAFPTYKDEMWLIFQSAVNFKFEKLFRCCKLFVVGRDADRNAEDGNTFKDPQKRLLRRTVDKNAVTKSFMIASHNNLRAYSWRDPLGWFGAVQLVDSLTHFVDSLTHFVVSWPTLLIRFPTLLMWINTTWKVGIRKWTSTRMLIRVLFRINILVNA